MRITINTDETPVQTEYIGAEKLSPEELAQVFTALLNDTLGPDPQLGDLLNIQRHMMGAMNASAQ